MYRHTSHPPPRQFHGIPWDGEEGGGSLSNELQDEEKVSNEGAVFGCPTRGKVPGKEYHGNTTILALVGVDAPTHIARNPHRTQPTATKVGLT